MKNLSPRSARHGVSIGAIFLALGTASPPLLAQSTAQQSATAESLFREGKQLMAQKKFEEACAKFSASHGLEPGLGTLLNLADCHEQLGATASAWAEFLRAAALARRANQNDREQVARDRAEALEPRLMRLKIVVSEDSLVAGLDIQRGSVPLESAAWGSAIPVDPGSYSVFARAPGMQTFEAQVALRQEGETVEVVIPKLEAAPVVVAPEPEVPVPAAPAPEPKPVVTSEVPHANNQVGGNQRIVGLTLGGAGLLGLAAGGVFGLLAKDAWDDADCTSGICPTPDSQSKADDARMLATFGTIGAAAGGTLVVVGAAVYFLAPSSPDPLADQARIHWLPSVSPDGAGVTAVGTF